MMTVSPPGALGVVENQDGAELADRRGAVALVMGEPEHGHFVHVVATEVPIDLAEDRVVLQERRHGAARGRHRERRIDGVAEIAGVAEKVAGRHRRCIGGGEGREYRMAVDEGDAFARQRRHVGRGRVVDGSRPQPVGDEDYDVMASGLGSGGLGSSGLHRHRTGGNQQTGNQKFGAHGDPRRK
jgi:hypothetical protein